MIAFISSTFLCLAKKNKLLQHLPTLTLGFLTFSLVMEMELLSGHLDLKGQNFLQVQTWQWHPSKYPHWTKNTQEERCYLVSQSASGRIWGSEHWQCIPQQTKASSSCYPTSQHICLETTVKHHGASPSSETTYSISHQWNTMQHLPKMKHHTISPSNEEPCSIIQGPKQLRVRGCSAGWDRASPSGSCWGQSRSCWLQTKPSIPFWSLTALISGSQTQSKLGCAEPYIRPPSAPSPPSLGTIEWCWKDKGKQRGKI